jgi:hypothetical protein
MAWNDSAQMKTHGFKVSGEQASGELMKFAQRNPTSTEHLQRDARTAQGPAALLRRQAPLEIRQPQPEGRRVSNAEARRST